MRNGENRSRAVGWRGVVLLGLVAWACSGKSRPFSDEVLPLEEAGDSGGGTTQGIDGAPVATPASPEGLAPNAPLDGQDGLQPGAPGSACTSNADCTAPNPCVDGVCCTSACTELCAACNVPGAVGTCSAAPADPACPALVCAGFDTECRTLDQTQLPLNCEAFAQCKLQASCASIPEEAGAACQAGAGSCDGAGACVVAGKAALGATCSSDVDCAEGHCVAGPDGALLCCDGACDGACQGCSAAGRCEVFPQQDERCEAVACPPDDVCRDYTADATASQCRSFGQCQTGRDCTFTALRPEAECACDSETGACALLAGAACGSSEQCQSGVCGANGQGATICCATACGAGLFCSSDGGGCVACEGDGVTCEGNTERRCNAGAIASTECPNGCTPGTGCNDLPPLGFTCDAGQCATPNVCQPDTTGRARCCSRDCAAEGKVCSENGSCVCQPGQVQVGADCLLADGDPCQNSEQCQVGSTCTDGVCCQEACAGACERCEPNTGACVAIAAGQQDPLCGVGRQCTGARGDCRLTVRQQCTGNGAECTTNNCEPTVGNATLICCAQACGADRPFCRSDGSSCVQCETNGDCGNGCNALTGTCNDLLPVGAPCGASAQCASSAQCLLDQSGATRCCERNCAAEGLLCNGAGACVEPAPATLVTVGLPPAAFSRSLVGAASNETRLWTVQNSGATATVPLSLASSASASQFSVIGNCLGVVLQASASCSISIGFAPRQAGQVSETLTLSGGAGVALSVQVSGDARLRDGSPCDPSRQSDCDANLCTLWLADGDGDGFGSPESTNGHPSVTICGDGSPANRPAPLVVADQCRPGDERQYEYAPGGSPDCCDNPCDGLVIGSILSSTAFPGAIVGNTEAANCGPGDETLDFNCNGIEQVVDQVVGGLPPACNAVPNAISAAECSARSGFRIAHECGTTNSRQFCGLNASTGLCTSIAADLNPLAPVCL